nr:MAG TPA: hypothetical protein [Caudoviricetes sp.]
MKILQSTSVSYVLFGDGKYSSQQHDFLYSIKFLLWETQ